MVDVVKLIQKGGIFFEVEGKNPKEIYKKITKLMALPDYITPDFLFSSLCEREKLISTAVGNGIALPHCRNPIVKNEDDEQVCMISLKNPVQMQSPDQIPVSTMFLILSHDQKNHLEILSQLFELLKNTDVKMLFSQEFHKNKILEELKLLNSK